MPKDHDQMLPGCAEMFGQLKAGQEMSKETSARIEILLTNHLQHEQARNDKLFWGLVKALGWSLGILGVGGAMVFAVIKRILEMQ